MNKIGLALVSVTALIAVGCGAGKSEDKKFGLTELYFGSYPQSEVKDSDLREKLTELAGELPEEGKEKCGKWQSYEYRISGEVAHFMWHAEVEEDGARYRGVYFTSYRPCYTSNESLEDNTYQIDNGYTVNNVYWFKYEPILWDILEKDGDEEAFVMSRRVLDSQPFYKSANREPHEAEGALVYENNWAHSDLRKFANGDFFDAAFTTKEKPAILPTTIDNSAASTGFVPNEYACIDTTDRIFPLSYKEATNPEYGFNEYNTTYDIARRKHASDYAKCMGVVVYYADESDYDDLSVWWLRSPDGAEPNYVGDVYYVGAIYAYATNFTSLGFLPAARFSLVEAQG